MSGDSHTHTPERRQRQHYDPNVILADAWVCAECEKRLCVDCGQPTITDNEVWCHDCGREHWYGGGGDE